MLAGKALPAARRLYAQRSAGRSLVPETHDFLSEGFDKTISQLTSGAIDQAWWRRLLDHFQQQWIAPEILRRGELQVWLQDQEVQVALKALARARVLSAPEGEEPWSQLRDRYAKTTGEPVSIADTAVDAVLAILLASFVVEMSPGEQRIAGLVQATAEEQRLVLERMEGKVDEVRSMMGMARRDLAIQVLAERVSVKLESLQKRRGLDPAAVRADIRDLAELVLSGDLTTLPHITKQRVLYWAVRLHASQPGSIDLAKRFRRALLDLEPGVDLRVIDALLLEVEDNANGALRLLRTGEDPDVRASLMAILHRSQGSFSVLEWFDNQEARDQPDFLTGIGWSNLGITLAEAGRWEEAVQRLARVQHLYENWPDLAFVEGVLNAALLLPAEFRPYALGMNVFHREMRPREGPDAEEIRGRARRCFLRAAELLESVYPPRASATRDWLLWLALTGTDRLEREEARAALNEKLEDPRTAMPVVKIAMAFDVPMDVERLWRYLNHRLRLGGLEGDEVLARYLLAQKRMSPGEFVTFLEQEESLLESVLRRDAIAFLRIEALVHDGQVTRARHLLESRRGDFGDTEIARISAMLDASEGRDPRSQLEELCAATGDLIDLKNLRNHLLTVNDWSALTPLLRDLFQRERTAENAGLLIDSMYRDPSFGATAVLEFLEANDDFVQEAAEFRHAKARALFYTGRLPEARDLTRRLCAERDDPADQKLAINLALQSGDWAQFPQLVEHVWRTRDRQKPESLLKAAALAAEVDATADRAFALVKLAAATGYDDPQVLANAIGLLFRLGREGEEIREWLGRALELSTDSGPVGTVDLKTIIDEWMPAARERAQRIEDLLIKGAIPLHLAAAYLNSPLSALLLEIPRKNSLLEDGRHRLILPVFAGNRERVSISPDATIALDLTSVLLLDHLDLLETVLQTSLRVLLAPDTMVFLLNERSRVRYHQPTQITNAKDVLELISSGRLGLATDLRSPPPELVEQVGMALAELLETARAEKGQVVRPLPVHKLGSFTEEAADLGAYDERLLSTIDLARVLLEEGRLSEPIYESAVGFLRSRDSGDQTAAQPSLSAGPIYLESLGLAYLQSAGVLDRLAAGPYDVRVHPSLKAEKEALISRHREGDRLAADIERIRVLLRDAIQDGRVGFLARREPTIELDSLYEAVPALSQFFADIGCCDVVSMDDRFINRNRLFADMRGNSASLVCTLDVIEYLSREGHLSGAQKAQIYHKLREGGFAFVPVEADELHSLLRKATLSESGQMFESAELRILRQYLARLQRLEMIEDREELTFLGRLQMITARVLYELWRDDRVPIDRAARLSDWLWTFVSPAPKDWLVGASESTLSDAYCRHLSLPLQVAQAVSYERREACNAWVETTVLSPMLIADPEVVDAVALELGETIVKWSLEFERDKKNSDS